ncbi:histidinol-phosphatase [Trueperella pecoris]|uniref:Histidinol-phosphatase n=1 Tax=Trueperella pecoris TaxID=2733571 RepID=A0A7M1R1K9_9ACTO|nr:histidinol-phosphatase [Trueperella pecoris]QOR48170.1 histidinol-phosphatase [Trueperella pecoris]
MTQPRYADDLQVALGIADRVDVYTMERFRAADLHVETKPDMTPVSDADKGAERLIRDLLRQFRSRDGVTGEEEEQQEGRSGRRWIIDPIDGTKNYVRGVPVWATLIALEDAGEIVLGIVSAPALKQRWFAAKGLGAYSGRSAASSRRIQVSQVGRISDASLSYSSLGGWSERQQLRGFLRLSQNCWRTRGFGDFWSYMLVAEGAVDIATEPELNLYDMAALVPIVTEAGGRFTSLEGEDGPWGGNAIATNGFLHEGALEILHSVRDDDL